MNEGSPAQFLVVATGTKPLSYQWQRDTVSISGAMDSMYTIAATVRADSGALFRCIVSNTIGSDTSIAARLHVLRLDSAKITVHPDSVTVNEGSPAQFLVVATGTKPLSYQWQRDTVSISGATDSMYTIAATVHADSGALFRCIVSNIAGNDTSRFGLLRVTVGPPPLPVLVAVKVYLQGPMVDTVMSTNLLNAGVIPLMQPYAAAPWNYAGTDSVNAIPAGVVDWVLIELRSDTASTTTLASSAAFVKSDGAVVDLDGTSAVAFSSLDSGNYFIVVRHRNHLPVMSSARVVCDIDTSPSPYDFSLSQSSAFSTGADGLKAVGTKFAMFSGDGNGDGFINAIDRNTVWRVQNGTLNVYARGDFNLDANVNATDRNLFWRVNNGALSQVP